MEHIVEYENYCHKCEFFEKHENESPCDDCLDVTARDDSRKPLHFKEKIGGGSNGQTKI